MVSMSQPAPERDEYEEWQALQDVLEERDREYWAGNPDDDEA